MYETNMTQDMFLNIYGAKIVLYKPLASIELKHLQIRWIFD